MLDSSSSLSSIRYLTAVGIESSPIIFGCVPTRHGIRYLCHADALHAHVHAPWLRPRDSCTLCPAGLGVPDTRVQARTRAPWLRVMAVLSAPRAWIRRAHTTRKRHTRDALRVIRTRLVLGLRRGKRVQTRTAFRGLISSFRGLISKSDQSGDRIPPSEV